MLETGFETRVKIQQVIENQFPEFILDESPKAVDFIKQYYISQEYQGGPIDITDNLDQYIKLDNLTPEVIVGSTELTSNISSSDEVISVLSTKGFPQKYGLLKIDDEIITYTGLTTNTFTGCIRGFSGITNYHQDLKSEELVFSSSTAASHADESKVENLSVLFLQEFYKKIKYSLTPGLENNNFVSNLNVGNFIKEASTLYKSKGTDESFRILFNILFGETPKVIDLEKFLIKPSSATYVRRSVVVADAISGDLTNLRGQTIYKNKDTNTSASVSEVEVISRKNKIYYKLLLFIGYDNSLSTITGNFNITGSTKNIEYVNVNDELITVDSTIGFPESGTLYCGDNVITYTSKSINQFFGCSGINFEIETASLIYSDETYYGYENNDISKKATFRITGVLSDYEPIVTNRPIAIGEKIAVKNLGEVIKNPITNKTYKEIFANSWIYNTSTRYQIESFSNSQITLKIEPDKSSLKVDDQIEILDRDSQSIEQSNLRVTEINGKIITLNNSINLNENLNYDIRRKIKTATSSSTSLEYSSLFSDVQNVYNEKNEYAYVASNSLPSYEITKSIFSYDVLGVDDYESSKGLYSTLILSGKVSFITGSKIYYTYSSTPIAGLSKGIYYVEVISNNEYSTTYQTQISRIKIYVSSPVVKTINYVSFGQLTSGVHNFTLYSQKEKTLSAQKILRKFPLDKQRSDDYDITVPGTTGMLINGVEILNYKSNDKIYYGPLETVNVLNPGTGYDVVNPPLLSASYGSALIQPIVQGSVEKIYIDPQDFDTDVVVSINLSGGNGSGASFNPIIQKRRREIEFDARLTDQGGGVDTTYETITFLTNHSLVDGEIVVYRPGNNSPLGIGTFQGSDTNSGNTLKNESEYYVKYISDTTIQLYPSISDYNSGINTVGFTTIGTSGIHKFATRPKNTLSEIKIISGGSGYTNRKLRVSSSGISTEYNSISFTNHGFNSGELVTYSTTGTSISGLSTSNQYYIIKVDDDKFRLSNAGVGGTIKTNYERNLYVSLGSTGSGYHIFNYPEISVQVEYSSVGLGSTQFRGSIVSTPIVRGKIVGTYVYEGGSDYGSEILNYHNKPSISVKSGKDCQVAPIIINGKIEKVFILNGGSEYYSTPDIIVSGDGVGCVLRPVVSNNRIVDVVVINSGYGYTEENTSIKVISTGKNVIFDPQVRSLTVNNNVLYDDASDSSLSSTNEVIFSSNKDLEYSVCGYFDTIFNEFKDLETNHSPIIGWAYDGNPIYGSFGYDDPQKNNSVKRLESGYTLTTVSNRPNFPQGFFVEDYEFTNSGDLDECNGRFCLTPEFPEGIYAYFATSVVVNQKITGSFPYFIGNRYRSKFIQENQYLNQSFNFNQSDLVRNTLPYKVNEQYAGNDFIIESNEIINQTTTIESVTKGSIEDFDIINSGINYKVGDTLEFDNIDNGGGLVCQVSEITGEEVVNLQASTISYSNASFTWDSGNTINVKISPQHNLKNFDTVKVSGFSTSLSELNGFHQIGVNTFSSTLIKDIPAYDVAGIVTDIYVSNIPNQISIGSSILIESETLSILNIFEEQNIIRVVRESTGTAHTSTTSLYFVPDKFTINKTVDYFDSKNDDIVYFNPVQSVGVGTTSGIGIKLQSKLGVRTDIVNYAQTQSIYIPNHPFETNQPVIFSKLSSSSAISVSNTSGGSLFSLPLTGDSQRVYIIKKSPDHIGIVTQVGLTTNTSGLFFTSNGSDNYQYSLRSEFTQVIGNISKNTVTVSLSTSHTLTTGDQINLTVKPNLSVGIGQSSQVKIVRDQVTNYILINPISFNSSAINTTIDQINLNSHNLQTGDKVKYTANVVAGGLGNNKFYYVYKIDDNNIKLSETYIDCVETNPPRTIDITTTGGSSQIISLVNPEINVTKNNNLVFNLTDTSLVGYNFKLFEDVNLKKEFVSTGTTNTFSIIGVGTVGVSTNASFTISYNSDFPDQLFYGLEKSGVVISPDKEVSNFSNIKFIDSHYQGSYKIFGVGTTTFQIDLKNYPEKDSYEKDDCSALEYTTNSTSEYGGIAKIKIISSGNNFTELPTFKGVNSSLGTGAYILPKSDNIGKINEIRILNEGFEYSSDKTLKPEALVPKLAIIKNFSTIDKIQISNNGKNYTSSPDLIIVNTETGEVIDSGLLTANVYGSSIGKVNIDIQPKGLPESYVTIRSINNTNGISIQSIQSSSSGIVTCTIVTPLTGFSIEPFTVGDKIFVEGIKNNNDGDGLNSSDYGYNFFTVSNYINANTDLVRKVEYNLSGLTTSPGSPSLIDNFYGKIINYKNYPEFTITQIPSTFIVGEKVQVKTQFGFVEEDLTIIEISENNLKMIGSYELQSNEVIRGIESGSIATINDVKESLGQFKIEYGSIQKLGWNDEIGKLNNDSQVIPNNDYYQNLSYSIKSNQEWENIVSPVNNLLHPSGLKNFADTEIESTVGVGTSISATEYTNTYYTIDTENRVDTINNLDLTFDINTNNNSSKFIKFKTKKLTDYIKCDTNRVLQIDDISDQFSSFNQRDQLSNASKIVDINQSRSYNKYLIQIIDKDQQQFQFNEIIVMHDDSDIFTLEKGSINTGYSTETSYNANSIGDVYGKVNDLGNYYIEFKPRDPFNTDYNIKYLNTTFVNNTTGVGTTSIGFISLTGITSTVSSGSTTILSQTNISNTESIHSEVHLFNNTTNVMNYVDIFVDHDGTNTNIAELYFDNNDELSSNFIGSFSAYIQSGVLTLNYTNTSPNNVTIRSRNVGFGTTNAGIATYRFKQPAQIDGYENTVNYISSYSNVSVASSIVSFDSSVYSSLKSTVKVSIGNTSALHQIMLITDGNDVYTIQYPFLSVGTNSGIGTFGGEIAGSIASLKFYPDPEFTGTFEILNFNEIFYRENDYDNTSPNLEYSNISESVGVSKYYGLNSDELNKLDFALQYQETPIFMKRFDPSNSSVLNLSTGEFNIKNHFFSTGEELIYRPNSNFIGVNPVSVGIGSTLNYVGIITNILPKTVYAIKIDNNRFKISTRKEYANAGIFVTFTSTGSGNIHELEMVKKNEKAIIAIDNIIQSPISYSLLNYTVNNGGQITDSSTIFGLSGISSIRLNDIIKIDDEYMKVVNVGFGTTYSGPISFAGTFPLVSVQRGFAGSAATTHSDLTSSKIYRGSYNIEKSTIYFTEPPKGGDENQSLAPDNDLPLPRSSFNGRVFLRQDYTGNQLYDNISEKFTGIGQTYTLTVGGANTVGLGTSGGNGILLINGIYQTPTTQNNVNNNFKIIENTSAGISSVVFSGITSSNGSIVISQSDVNMNELPRGGIIVSLGSTPGLGYAPLVGASVTAVVSGGSITSIGIGTIGNWGSGYRGIVPVSVYQSGHTGSAATITASVGLGGTLSFTIVNGGSGYTNPSISVPSPSYNNLPVIGVSRLGIGTTTDCGVGLLLNVDVGASSTTGIGSTLFEISNFEITRSGYGFKPGDVIKPIGLVTARDLSSPISEFRITILDTFTDAFSCWQFGELDFIDSIENYQDGERRTFPLYYNSELLSFERDSSSQSSQLIDFNTLLVIFINSVPQKPGVSYNFEGGSSFTFTEAPKVDDNISIYFYRGTRGVDSKIINVNESVKPGDDVQIYSNNGNLENTVTQNSRVIVDIKTSDIIETNLYNSQGIDKINEKPLYWTKQKIDKIINGEIVSKSRDSIESQIYPTAKIIKNITTTDNELFVDNAILFNYENELSVDFDAIIISDLNQPISAAMTAVVSSAGTIQSLSITNPGSGYTGSSLSISISSPPRIGLGIGTVAQATVSIVNGSVSTATITNPGFGYTISNPPQVLVPLPDPVYENISNVISVGGTFGNVVGIATTVGIGTNLAIRFTLQSTSGLVVGNPIYIYNTRVGSGVTSIKNTNTSIVGIGTTFLDNIYEISAISSGIITCNVHSQTNIIGISTTGSNVGNFSWGKLSGFTRSSSPIAIGVSGYIANSGLTSFPTVQRRGYGLRNNGSIKKSI